MILKKQAIKNVKLNLPSRGSLILTPKDIQINEKSVVCSIIKDSGDDPDVTDGIKIFAKVEKSKSGIKINGGIGVGRVTKAGLPCKVGEAAINPKPLKMIKEVLLEVADRYHYDGGFKVEIFVPQGIEVSKRTFNERLGILGGISILGTTGIVEPMSETSIIESIKLEINTKKHSKTKILFVCPGNYGLDFAKDHLGIDINSAIKCSNYIGEVLDYVVYLGYEKLLFVSHIGKLVKLAAGVMNTHSKIADCRNEVFASHCALVGTRKDTIKEIMEAKTTNEIHGILVNEKISEKVYKSITRKIIFHMNYRVMNKLQIEVVGFSNENGVLIRTDKAKDLIRQLKIEVLE